MTLQDVRDRIEAYRKQFNLDHVHFSVEMSYGDVYGIAINYVLFQELPPGAKKSLRLTSEDPRLLLDNWWRYLTKSKSHADEHIENTGELPVIKGD